MWTIIWIGLGWLAMSVLMAWVWHRMRMNEDRLLWAEYTEQETSLGYQSVFGSMPDKEVEEELKRYRCESCGKDFDEKIFSHSRTEENQLGDPVEVECGPISEVK